MCGGGVCSIMLLPLVARCLETIDAVNQIDHVVKNNKWRRSLKDVHTCRGADAGSDHYLVVSRLKLCLRKTHIKHDRQRRYNIGRLKYEDTLKAFVLEVKNKFQKLSTDELDHPPVEER